jgi:hypothetical protein
MRARVLILVVLLVSYGAVGARQPAVRMAVPLPAPIDEIASALDITNIDRSQFLLSVVRVLFGIGMLDGDKRQRGALRQVLDTASKGPSEAVPLPLDASIWRETLLPKPVPNEQLIATILTDRTTALMYHGLAGMDDDTLAWLGAERGTLQHLMKRPGAFAVFGPNIRIHAGEIAVPGGESAKPVWQALLGGDPAKPANFIRRVFSDDEGWRAWFYDSVSQLDEARFKFALGEWLPAGSRQERARALLDVFTDGTTEWNPENQPFSRRQVDPGLTLTLISVKPDGTPIGPLHRGLWERVFAHDARQKVTGSLKNQEAEDSGPVDAAWLLSRIHRVPVDVSRRRLETFLFAQRMFPTAEPNASLLTALQSYVAFPALMLTLERAGVRSLETINAAAVRAEALNEIGDLDRRRTAMLQFQAALGIVERMQRRGGLKKNSADTLVGGLARVPTTSRGYEGKLAGWIRSALLPSLYAVPQETQNHAEDIVLAAMAGVTAGTSPLRVVDWEDRKYRVGAAAAEAQRLQKARRRQGGLSLDAALAEVDKTKNEKSDLSLANTLTSILYAGSLGDPDGPALSIENIATRHDLESSNGFGPRTAWRLPTEGHTQRGWRVSGSLLGLDTALARMALRRLDATVMPLEPRLVSAERQTAALSVALLNPGSLNDATRDEIAAALGRGRARLSAVSADRSELDAIAKDAGLSAWRREALAWSAANDREHLSSQLSLVETLWLGRPRMTDVIDLDSWGAAALPWNGCLCLLMPRAGPWEMLTGRPSLGLLATRGADVAILVADALAAANLPAEIAPGVIAYAMQDVMDRARPAYFDDWPEFSRAASAISRDALGDYIAAQAAGGALLPARSSDNREH